MNEIEKYISGDMAYYTDPTTGIVWHNDKFIQKLKKEAEGLKGLVTASSKQQLKLLAKIESLEEENKELKEKLDSYEEYGGALDEGQAWADEAMSSREKLRKLMPILEQCAEYIVLKMKEGLQIIEDNDSND